MRFLAAESGIAGVVVAVISRRRRRHPERRLE